MHKRHAAGLALALLLAGCARGPEFVEGPTVEPNPNPRAPLAAVLRFETDVPVTTTVDIGDGANAWTLEYAADEDSGAGLALVGMRPGRTHRIEVTVRDGAGREGPAVGQWHEFSDNALIVAERVQPYPMPDKQSPTACEKRYQPDRNGNGQRIIHGFFSTSVHPGSDASLSIYRISIRPSKTPPGPRTRPTRPATPP